MVGQSLLRRSAIVYSGMAHPSIPGEDFIAICEELEKFDLEGAIEDFTLYPDYIALEMKGTKKRLLVIITPNTLRFRDRAGGAFITRHVPNERMYSSLSRVLRAG